MHKKLICLAAVCACLVFAASTAAAQKHNEKKDNNSSSLAVRAPVVVVGSAAKASWVITKFTTTKVAAPVAKAIIVRGAPKATLFLLKNTGLGAKYALPLAIKLSLL